MSRTPLQSFGIALGILIFNLIAFFAGLIAIAYGIFKDEWIITILPAAIALVAIILQPWSLLLFLLPPITQPLHPFTTTVLTLVIYSWLERKGKLERIKQRLRGFKVSRIFQLLLIFLLPGLGITYARYRDFPALKPQPPSIVQDAIKREKIAVEGSRSYTVFNFLNSEYIWQASISGQNFAKLRENLGLKPTKMPQNRFINKLKDYPPYWWNPVLSPKTQAYATPGFSFNDTGTEGVHIFLIWNSDSQRVNLLLRSNF